MLLWRTGRYLPGDFLPSPAHHHPSPELAIPSFYLCFYYMAEVAHFLLPNSARALMGCLGIRHPRSMWHRVGVCFCACVTVYQYVCACACFCARVCVPVSTVLARQFRRISAHYFIRGMLLKNRPVILHMRIECAIKTISSFTFSECRRCRSP